MDNSEITISNRQICCRLCLAPDNECVPIFTNSAADKEPLSSKIQACVNIKVHETDRLSSRICHYCISYLNSWQSFKNRCLAAQKKQRTLLFLLSEKQKFQRQHAATQAATIARRQLQHQLQRNLLNFVANKDGGSGIQNEVQDEDRNNATNQIKNNDVDLTCVKEEPQEMISDDEDQNNMNVELDPSQFLANNEDDDDYQAYDEREPVPAPIISMEEGPPILTSLGLTHVNHVNSCNFVKTEADYGDDLTNSGELYNSFNDQKLGGPIPGACSICDMKFSNRANARRHERNIHGILPNPLTFTPQISNPTTINPAAVKPVISRKVIHVPEVYNYETPEKYRPYLTENKIKFIRNNLTFLEQYQDMICACCDRQYQTYKAFMSHMRKKYQFLPRNLCFKCLKQFETKGQFIAHLKKRNCINLYKLYMIDESITKPELTEEEKARNKTKDILANKDYGCKLCGLTFKLKMDFRAHVFEQHADNQKGNDVALTICGFCNVKFEDAPTKKRHYTNLECIISIICGSCGEKFTQHPHYIDHVYTNHLSNANANDFNEADSYDGEFETSYQSTSRLRTPQNCAVCGKQYNNYYNVLRHMESKHPDQLPQTYSCEHCQTGFPRQSELREHIKLNHRDSLFRTPTSSANVSVSGGIKQSIISCNDCGLVCETRDIWIEHMTTHSKFVCPQCEYKTESKEEYNNHLSTHLKFKLYSCVICKHSFNNEKGLDLHMKTIHNQNADDELGSNEHSDECKDNDTLQVSVKREMIDEIDVSINNNDNDNDNDDDIDNTMEENSNMGDSIQPSDNDNTNGGTQSPPKQRECPICKSIFNAGVSFSNHMRTHMVSSPHQNFLRTLNVSGQPIVKPSRMRCRLCQKRINTKLGLKRHMLLAHQIRDYTCVKCYMCPAEFSSHKGLRVHLLKSHQIAKAEDDANTMDGGLKIKTETSINNFECHICHIVYKNKDDLKHHCSSVHGFELPTEDIDSKDNLLDEDTLNETKEDSFERDYWYQCRYCVDTFNSGKQLTVHMNTHEEQYPTDYSCKDCGNVYNTRKSLWVHRYNKHPRPPNPTVCEICKKVFFDKTELFYHLKTHSQSNTNAASLQSNLKFSSPSTINQPGKYACHVCGQKFHEKGPLSKHIKMHELENNSFGGNPLMSMFDEGGSTSGGNNGNDYDSGNDIKTQFQEQIRMVNGEYACDLCPKTFPILNALHVHRGWHFRSPSGRQVTDPSQTWQPDSIPPSKLRRMRNPYGQPPTCPYCSSTFASTNNLRRHIVEVHKRNEAKLMRESASDNAGFYVEKIKECRSCNMSFNTTTEWIDHKIIHARNQKPSTTFEWGCEICGKMFTRKERLLQHMITHLNSREFDEDGNFTNTGGDGTNENSMEPSQMGSELNFESNSQSSQSSMSSSSNEQNNEDQNDDNDNYDQDEMMSEPDNSELPESLSCELCQKRFTSTATLREHISNHILNGNLQSDPTESSQKSNEQDMQQSSNNFCQISNMF